MSYIGLGARHKLILEQFKGNVGYASTVLVDRLVKRVYTVIGPCVDVHCQCASLKHYIGVIREWKFSVIDEFYEVLRKLQFAFPCRFIS